MKNIIYIILGLFLFGNISFAEEKINISVNKTVIDITSTEYNSNVLFPGYKHSIFDLFKLNFSNSIIINKHESRIVIKREENHNYKKNILEKNPIILDFLIKRLGEKKIKTFIDSGFLNIIGDNNKTGSYLRKYTSNYYFNKDAGLLIGEYLEVTHKFKIYNEKSGKIKISLNPFDENIFLGYRRGFEGTYPVLSIFDNSLLPQKLKLIIDKKVYFSEIKYTLQGYNINKYYSSKKSNNIKIQKSYVLIPSYEFNLDLNKGESILEVAYSKFLGKNSDILIQESY